MDGALTTLKERDKIVGLDGRQKLENQYLAGKRERDSVLDSLSDGKSNGIVYAMRATIDNVGRLVIPKEIRREAGLKPGLPLDVRWENGKIAITPAPLSVKLERRGRLLVAVPRKSIAPLETESVEQVRKTVRQERSSRS